MMTSIQHSIIGLPFSGKTTYLAALWHLLNENDVSLQFTLDQLIGDHTHLNVITNAWAKCEEVPRTSMQAEATVAIHVNETASGKKAILQFPDLSGESYEAQLATRTCTPEYVEGFSGSGGILLFVNANAQQKAMSIVDIAPVAPNEAAEEQVDAHREWSPEMVSTQVNLVDLLQFLQQRPFQPSLRRVAIIVSAWDVIDNPDLMPDVWLVRNLPFLHQFLLTNSASFEFRVYGVSAQGGNLKDSDKKSALLEQTPSTRICCVGPDSHSHDLTSPIVWLMAGT